MGDAGLILGCLIVAGVIYTIILFVFGKNTEATPRPDLEGEKG